MATLPIVERFENTGGDGYDNPDFDDNLDEGGPVDAVINPNYTGYVISGTQSLLFTPGGDGDDGPFTGIPFDPVGEVYTRFRFRVTSYPVLNNSDVFMWWNLDLDTPQVLALLMDTDGGLKLSWNFVGSSSDTVLSLNTDYWIWVYVGKGTGSNGVAWLKVATTPEQPGSPTVSVTTHTYTDDFYEAGPSGLRNAASAFIFDDLYLSEDPIPDAELPVEVELASVHATAAYRIEADPDVEAGDTIQARRVGEDIAPPGLIINTDATFYFDDGFAPESFQARVSTDDGSTWGAWALQTVNVAESEAADFTAASSLAASFAATAETVGALSAGVSAGAALGAQAAAQAALAAAASATAALSGRADAIAAISAGLEAGDVGAGGKAIEAALSESLEADAQIAALAEALAAIEAGIEAGEEWAGIAAAAAGLVAGVELGASFLADTQGAQSAALAAGTEAAAQFLGAVAAFGLLSAGADAGDAFAASASVSGAWTSAASVGASFGIVSGGDVSLSAAAEVQAQFTSVMSGAGLLSAPVSAASAFGAISAAMALMSAGVLLGASFTAVSSADFSIVGAVATVRAIQTSASVRAVRVITSTVH